MITSTANSTSRWRLGRGLAALAAVVALMVGPVALAQPAQAYYPKPVMTTKPAISGAPVVGSVLTVFPGRWNAQPPLFITYAWRSPKSSMLSANNHYTPTKADIGLVLTVRVTATDGNNNSTYVDVSTPPITVSDIVSVVAPALEGGLAVGDTARLHSGTFTSGSGPLTYTYAWSRTDGTTSTLLPATGKTYRITKADLGLYISVLVTAKSATEEGTATARSVGAIVPTPPFASDAGLTSSNRGHLAGKAASNFVTITDSAGKSAAHVFVYGYSTPIQLGWFPLDERKQFTVSIAPLAPGAHKLAILDSSGKLVGWLQVNRDAPSLSSTANEPIAIVAAAVLVLAIVTIVVTANLRRRRRGARRH